MNQKVYTRQYYIDKIRGFYHSDLIKVVTGIRRCGKSFFLLSVMEDLKKSGVNEKDIIYLNLDKRGYRNIKTPDALEEAIEKLITDDDFKYLFIDEVQMCTDFEIAINSFHASEKYDIYITGSNAFLFSNDLATLFTGRTFEIHVFPFSFKPIIISNKRS